MCDVVGRSHLDECVCVYGDGKDDLELHGECSNSESQSVAIRVNICVP